MIETLKNIFELFIGKYEYFENEMYNVIILLITGLISFFLTLILLFKYNERNSEDTGTILKWIVGLVVFFVILSIVSHMIQYIMFLSEI